VDGDVLTSRNVTPIVPAAPWTESIRASTCEVWQRVEAAVVDVDEDTSVEDEEDVDDDAGGEDDDDKVEEVVGEDVDDDDPPDEWHAASARRVVRAADHAR
jgi:hypothetical protein